jgi:hypothetical protein
MHYRNTETLSLKKKPSNGEPHTSFSVPLVFEALPGVCTSLIRLGGFLQIKINKIKLKKK